LGTAASAAKPAPARDWSKTVVATPEGGFRMGNPAAKVKLVEISSLACSRCKAFEDEAEPTLVDKYVKPGNVSWEFRPFVIHGQIDLAAILLMRCNGVKAFFPLAQALYYDQAVWLAKLASAPKARSGE
jgi:protein-disulfide isomerase